MKQAIRNSNIELLRIVCMLMVVVLHFNNNGANTGIVNMPEVLTGRLTWGFLVESFCIVAVNCFVLVSGYFGIKLKWRSLIKFYLQCFLIGLVSYLAYIGLKGEFSWQVLAERLLAFTHNGWWFVVSYLGLMLLSPILNKAVEGMTSKQLLHSILFFTVVMLYLGWYHKVEATNYGNSLISFLWLYLIGRYIGTDLSLDTIRRWRWVWLAGYVAACMGLFTLIMLRYHCALQIHYPLDYNNPFVVIAAVMLLLFFLSFSFQSKAVNWLASSVFAAYLLQESVYLGHLWLYPRMRELFVAVPDGYRILALLGVSVVFLLICVSVDKILGLFSRVVLKGYDKICTTKVA
jgi:surface polysaccharide O-acyltransferase-like enzyme